MLVVRRAVVAKDQADVGTSTARRWMIASGVITAEAIFEEDPATTCTALVIELLGSISGVKYFVLASHTFTTLEKTNNCAMFHVVDKPIMFIKTNISTLTKTGDGDVKVTINLLSYD